MYLSEKLAVNRLHYPEFRRVYHPKELDYAKRQLLNLPLFHSNTTDNPHISPSVHLPPEHRHKNTEPLDISLGLDRFVFLTWGIPNWSKYGSYMHAINPEILLSRSTVITPSDILPIAEYDLEFPYEKLSKRIQKRINTEYFGKMLSGADWLELMSRKVVDKIRSGAPLFVISDSGVGMGEIKHEGQLGPSHHNTIYCGRQNLEENYYPQMYRLGFGHEGVETVRQDMVLRRRRTLTDPLPEELGIDYNSCIRVWDPIRTRQ